MAELERDVSDDELFADLEKEIDDDFDMGALRERRLEELKQEMNRVKEFRANDHGKLTEIKDEKEVLKISSSEHKCAIHFFHNDFKRCQIMDNHLQTISEKYFSTRFLRVNVENVPWLVHRLGIKVLPCVICFVDGTTKDRLVGFEELGNNDNFTTASLELRLEMCGVIEKPKLVSTASSSSKVYPAGSSSSRKIRDGTTNDSDSD